MPIFLIQGGPNGTISFQFYLIPRLTSMGTEIIFEKLFSVYSIESSRIEDFNICSIKENCKKDDKKSEMSQSYSSNNNIGFIFVLFILRQRSTLRCVTRIK